MPKTALSNKRLVLSQEHVQFEHPLPMPAHKVVSDDEALKVASQIAVQFNREAILRDRVRAIPASLMDSYSNSGLWAITVPKRYGGAGVSVLTLTEVIAVIAEADPSLAQLPQNHYNDVDTINWVGSDRQKSFFFGEVLAGKRFGNAFAESKGHSAFATKLTRRNGQLILNGQKIYATGALFSHWVQVGAIDENDNNVLAFVPRHSLGLSIIDDWSGFGQRSTASGTVRLVDVAVSDEHVIPAYKTNSLPTTNGALSQIMHAAIDLGIGRAAVKETISFLNSYSRPWPDAHVEKAADDPLTVVQIGNLEYRLHAAEAMLERAAMTLDNAAAEPTDSCVAEASVAVAEAKAATTELAIMSANKLFELAGTQSTFDRFALDRHWRNARTHTLHDPVRWKYHTIGNYYLNDIYPTRHGWI